MAFSLGKWFEDLKKGAGGVVNQAAAVVDDWAAPDFGGQKRTFSQNYDQVTRDVGNWAVTNPVAKNTFTPFLTGAAQPALGVASIFSPQAGRFANEQRQAVNSNANFRLPNQVPLVGGQNPFMLAGEIALDPTTYVPGLKGANLGQKMLTGSALGGLSGLATPTDNNQDRLQNIGLGMALGGALPPVARYAPRLAAPTARMIGKGAMAGAKIAGQGSIKLADVTRRTLAPSADDILATAARNLEDNADLFRAVQQVRQQRWNRNLVGSREDMRRLASDIGLPPATQTMSAGELKNIFDNIYEKKPLNSVVKKKLEKSRSEGGFATTDLLTGPLGKKVDTMVNSPKVDNRLPTSTSIRRAADIETEIGRAATPQEQTKLFNEWERAFKKETITPNQNIGRQNRNIRIQNADRKRLASTLAKEDPMRQVGAKLPIKPNVTDRNANFPSQVLSAGGRDKKAFSYQRESLLRNLEETFGRGSEQTKKMKSYLLDPILQNETNRTKMVNRIRGEMTNLMKQSDIKRSSKEDFAAADYIEGTLSADDLRSKFGNKADGIIRFAEEGRRIYKDLLTRTNEQLTKYGYDPIPERSNYVTHTTQLTTFWDEMGNFLNFDKDKLPTAMSAINTQTKPGKKFNPFAQRREGGSTHEGLATAMDKYLDITTQQMYHTADVQRARSIQNYLQRQAESAGDNTTELSNFTDYIGQYADMLAGKKSMIDRPVEKIIGRGVYKAANTLRQRFGANAIGGSISSAVTNFVPLTQTLATTNKIAAIKGLLANMKLGDEAVIDGVESAFLRRRFPMTRTGGNTKTIVRDTVSGPFQLVDKFTSKSIVAGKFYEGVQKGLDPQTAMRQADEYAARAMSDRSLGQSPLLFNSQTLGLFTQFQNEVNNQLSFIGKDIPKNLGMNKVQAASALTQLAVFGYLYNELYEKMNGRRPAIDPIDYALNALQGNWGEVGEGVLNTVPFASSVAGAFGMETGRIPMAGGIPDITNIANDPIKELTKPLAYFALPYGGGQIKKTVEGLSTYQAGGDFAKDGDTKFKVEATPANLVRSAAFGKWSTPEAQEYIKGIGKTKPASKDVTAGITDTDPATRIEALKEEKKRIEKLQDPGFMREGVTEDERESMLADIEKQISLAELEEKFVLKGDTSTTFGKNRQKEKFETAITDVYKSWLDGEIEEEDVERIFREQNIDPEMAEFTFVKSLDDAEVAPWVIEQYQQYGDESIAKMIDQDVLTTSITKQMYDQDLISKDQKKYLDSLINEKTASGREANAKAKKGKKLSIKINRSAGPKAPAFISMNTTGMSNRITPPKFKAIKA